MNYSLLSSELNGLLEDSAWFKEKVTAAVTLKGNLSVFFLLMAGHHEINSLHHYAFPSVMLFPTLT